MGTQAAGPRVRITLGRAAPLAGAQEQTPAATAGQRVAAERPRAKPEVQTSAGAAAGKPEPAERPRAEGRVARSVAQAIAAMPCWIPANNATLVPPLRTMAAETQAQQTPANLSQHPPERTSVSAKRLRCPLLWGTRPLS